MKTKIDRVQVNMLVDGKQAINELGKLELEASELRQSMKGVKKDTEQYISSSKKLKEVDADIKKIRDSADLSSLSLRQISRYQRELNREFSNLTPAAASYKSVQARLKDVNAELAKQRGALRQTKSFWAGFKEELLKFGLFTLSFLGFQELIGQIDNLIASNAKLSDAMADVQKTTGLTRQEVEKLNKELKKIDTRTSRAELLGLAKIAGKLGREGKENVLGFVRAADQIVVALGEDLGGDAEGTIRAVGKLVDVFKVKDEFGFEKGLIKVGSAINALGAASTASEAFLVDFSKRLGGIAPNAKISIAEVLGLAATLDQLGQTSESSSTAMGQLLVSFAQDIPAFAKIAGLSIQEFANLLANDANEALIQVLNGARSTTGGLAGMAETLTKLGVDGARAASVVGVLSNNIELLRNQQKLANVEFEKGDSLTKEFNTKNRTFAATLDKIRKRLAGMFVNSSFLMFLEKTAILLEKITRAEKDFSDGLREQEKQLYRTQESFRAEMELLRHGNLSVEERNRLIDRMNTVYKDLLPSMITEENTMTELNILHASSINIMKEKIKLKAKEAEITEKVNKAAHLEIEQEKAKKELMRAKIRSEKERAKSPDGATESITTGMYGLQNVQTALGAALDAQQRLENKIAERQIEIDNLRRFMEAEFGGGTQLQDMTGQTAIEEFRNEKASLPASSGGTKKAEDSKPVDKSLFEVKDLDDALERWKEFNKKVKEVEEQYGSQSSPAQALTDKYKNMQDLAFKFYQDGFISEQTYLEKLQEINNGYLKETLEMKKAAMAEEAEEARKAREAQLKADIDMWNARSNLFSEFSSLITATNQLISEQGAKQSNFQKQLAIMQIIIDTAASMSKAVSAALSAGLGTGAAAPFTTPIFIAQMTGSVITAMAKAKGLISKANVPKVPGYKRGGYTKGIGILDGNGDEIAGLAHEGEYYIPKELMGDPIIANMVAIAEGMRMKRHFSSGNIAPSQAPPAISAGIAPTTPQASNASELKELASQMARFNSIMEEMQANGLPTYFTRKEREESDKYMREIESYRQESRL